MISLVLWLWRDEANRHNKHSAYSVDKVHRAAAMIQGSMLDPHEIVVITDQPAHEFASHLRIVPLWDDGSQERRCYRRLKAFDDSMRALIGPRFAWLDLDLVITGDISPLFRRKEPVVFWKSDTTRTPYNGSMVLMTAGARSNVWTTYTPSRAKEAWAKTGYPGSDQAWWSYVLGPGEAVWTCEQDGVCAYWQNCRPSPPDNCRVVYFPGSLKDNGSYVRMHSPWVKSMLDAALPLSEEQYQWKKHSPPTKYRGRTRPLTMPGRRVVGGPPVVE